LNLDGFELLLKYIFISVSFNSLLALLSLTASGISYLDEKVTQTKKSEDAE